MAAHSTSGHPHVPIPSDVAVLADAENQGTANVECGSLSIVESLSRGVSLFEWLNLFESIATDAALTLRA